MRSRQLTRLDAEIVGLVMTILFLGRGGGLVCRRPAPERASGRASGDGAGLPVQDLARAR